MRFAHEFARRVAPQLTQQEVVSLHEAILGSGSHPLMPSLQSHVNTPRKLQLRFRHECLHQGCLEEGCLLCKNNPKKRCVSNFCQKYFVQDTLRAKCGALIKIELVDSGSGEVLTSTIPDLKVQLCGINGQAFDIILHEHRGIPHERIKSCFMLSNKRGDSLLVLANNARETSPGVITMHLTEGSSNLPDVTWTDSSEALLSGRKPPLRLYAFAVISDGLDTKYDIVPAVSEPFCVATRRAKTSEKAEFPFRHDSVNKLKHMGRESVKKLADLRASEEAFKVSLHVPYTSIQTVGEFREVVLLANKDSGLRSNLQCVLKLNDDKWTETSAYALNSITPDNVMRVWHPDPPVFQDYSVLFSCHLGRVDLTLPVAVSYMWVETPDNETIVKFERLSRQEQDLIRSQQHAWLASWWSSGHPGWSLHGLETDYLESCRDPVILVGSRDSHAVVADGSRLHDEVELTTAFGNHGVPVGEGMPNARDIDRYPRGGSLNTIHSNSDDFRNCLDWLAQPSLDNFPSMHSRDAKHCVVQCNGGGEQVLAEKGVSARVSMDYGMHTQNYCDEIRLGPERMTSGLYTMRSIEMNLPVPDNAPVSRSSKDS